MNWTIVQRYKLNALHRKGGCLGEAPELQYNKNRKNHDLPKNRLTKSTLIRSFRASIARMIQKKVCTTNKTLGSYR